MKIFICQKDSYNVLLDTGIVSPYLPIYEHYYFVFFIIMNLLLFSGNINDLAMKTIPL